MWIKAQDGTYINDAHLQTMYVAGNTVMGRNSSSGHILLGNYNSVPDAKTALDEVVSHLKIRDVARVNF